MMTLVYLIFIGLLSRTSGQVPVVSFSKPYVNKSETVTITCTVVTVSDTVVISKDGINLFRCLSLPIPCTTLDPVAAAYVAVKNMSAGTTAVTIGVSSISRDTGNWTCLYGAASKSTPVSLAVVAPSSSTRLIEEPGYIILELNCTYPNRSLGLTFYLGAKMYTEGSLEESSVPCDDYEASLNYTLKFPSQHSNSYDGIFNVFYNNGFYVARISGTRHYTFSSTTTTNTTTVTSSSTSMSSSTSSVTINNTSINPTTRGSAANATISTSTSITPTAVSPVNNTNNTSTTTNPTISGSTVIATNNTSTSTNPTISGSTTINNTTSNKSKSDIDIKVIVPAVVVPCGLLIIGGIVLVVCCVRDRTRKNVRESPDGMAIQDKGNNIEGWKQSQGHGKATDNLDAVYTTPDGFIIYPGPAARPTARSYKEKKYHNVKDQYNRPYPGTYHHQAAYIPSEYVSTRAYTHKDKKRHGVTDQYSRPYTGTYGYQAAYVPNTYMSARTYAQKGKKYDYQGPIHKQASHQMATSRLVFDQTAYYSQTGHYLQSSQDVYYSGGGQYSYGQRSRSHHNHNGRKQQREYYNQYEMADYGDNRVGYRNTKQDMAFYY